MPINRSLNALGFLQSPHKKPDGKLTKTPRSGKVSCIEQDDGWHKHHIDDDSSDAATAASSIYSYESRGMSIIQPCLTTYTHPSPISYYIQLL